MKKRVRDIAPSTARDKPSLEDHFEGENEGLKPFEGTGIPKKHLSERRGGSRAGLRCRAYGAWGYLDYRLLSAHALG